MLAFTASVEPTNSDVAVGDVELTSWEKLEIVAALEDGTVIGWDVEESRDDEALVVAIEPRVHRDFEHATKDGLGDSVLDDSRQMGLIDDCEYLEATVHGIGDETTILNDKDLVLGVRDDSSLVLRHLHASETLEFDHGVGHCGGARQWHVLISSG